MGLDNFPIKCECGKHTYPRGLRPGHTHRVKDPCPFNNEFPLGILGGCCWLRGKVAAHELAALGEEALGDRMYEDMTAEEAESFAQELRVCADRLEREHNGSVEKPGGAGWSGTWEPDMQVVVWADRSTFEEALAEIRLAAHWYEKVGRLGYGVRAWS